MPSKCPNKSSQEWKALVEVYGEDAAYLAYLKANEDIPSLEEAKFLLGVNENGMRLDSKSVLSNFLNFGTERMQEAALDHLLRQYPNVQFFTSREAFENFVRTNFSRELHVSAENVGLAFKNVAFIDPKSHRQDVLLHELGHIYFDSLPDSNPSKKALRELFFKEGELQEVTDEAIVRAIGLVAYEHAESMFAPDMWGKLVNAIQRFWRSIKIHLHQASERDLIMDMADQLWNNRAKLSDEIFQSDVTRSLIVPTSGNRVGVDYDDYGRHTTILTKKLQSASSLIKVFFGTPAMDVIEGMQENKLLRNMRNISLGKKGISLNAEEQAAIMHMKHLSQNSMDKMGTAIHAAANIVFGANSKNPSSSTLDIATLSTQIDSIFNRTERNMVFEALEEVKRKLEAKYGIVEYHPELSLASTSKGLFGRLDLVFKLSNGMYVIADFKTVNESLFEGKSLSRNYMKVLGRIRIPAMKEIAGVFTKLEIFKMHELMAGIPNTKHRQHQLQALIYKSLLEDQLDEKGNKINVQEVIFVPLIRSMEPKVVVNSFGSIDRNNSHWELYSIKMDSDFVTLYNAKITGPTVPSNSTYKREITIQEKLLTILEKVKVVNLSSYEDTISNNIKRAAKRTDAVAVKMAYDAYNTIQSIIGKSLAKIRSIDVQDMMNVGLHSIYNKAYRNIDEKAFSLGIELPEHFMNQLSHEQIYWAATGTYMPDLSDVANGSLSRKENHSDPLMRFQKVKTGEEYSWADHTTEKSFNDSEHFAKPIRLSVNGGMQTVVFKEYGLNDLGTKIKEGDTVMLPPTIIDEKGSGMGAVLRLGTVSKIYNGSFTVEVENEDGVVSSVFVSSEDSGKDYDVMASDAYGVYLVTHAKGNNYNINENDLKSTKALDRTLDSWRPSFEEMVQPIMGTHFLNMSDLQHAGNLLEVREELKNSYKGLWQIFETMPTNKDMFRMFDDTNALGLDKNKFGTTRTSDLEHAYGLLIRTRMQDVDPHIIGPAQHMLNAIEEAMFCNMLAAQIVEEAETPSPTLPKWTMTLHNIIMNSSEGKMLSVSNMRTMLSKLFDQAPASMKLPRLVEAKQHGVNIFKDILADAYNDSQGMILSYTKEFDDIVRRISEKGYDIAEIMERRPSKRYVATAPYVFVSPSRFHVSKPELEELLLLLEKVYQESVTGFSKIEGTIVPIQDMESYEIRGFKRRGWRGRFVDLFGSKAWDSERIEFDIKGNGQPVTKTLREWKITFLELNGGSYDAIAESGVIGTWLDSVKRNVTQHSAQEHRIFSSAKMVMLDRMARTQYEKKNGKGKENRMQRLYSVTNRSSGFSQSLIPTEDVEISLRKSIKICVTASLMSKLNPVANFAYNQYVKENNMVAADFIYGQMASYYPGLKKQDNSVLRRIVNFFSYTTALSYLGLNLVAQRANFLIGQMNNMLHSPSDFYTGWSLFMQNPAKAIRILKYYKVITITEDFVYDPDQKTFINKLTKASMTPMQIIENSNHVILVLGQLGRRIFENLDNEVVVDQKDSYKRPKRGYQYRVDIPNDPSIIDMVVTAIQRNGGNHEDAKDTLSRAGFVWAAPMDVSSISGILGISEEELTDGVIRRKNDYDLPSKALINRILMADVGVAQGDYRMPLRNAFSHSTVGAATMMLRKWYPAIYSQTVMSSKRDSNYEMMVSLRDWLASEWWYFTTYVLNPYYKDSSGNKSKSGSKTERRKRYLEQAMEQMMEYNLTNSEKFDLINMESGTINNDSTSENRDPIFKGKRLATVLVLNNLMDRIMQLDDANLSIESLMNGTLNDEGKELLDDMLLQLAKNPSQRGTIMSNRARNLFLITSLATAILLFIASPDDDEQDANGNVMLTQMPYWKRALYTISWGTVSNSLGAFVLPSKVKQTYQPLPQWGYVEMFYKKPYDKPWERTVLERMAGNMKDEKILDAIDHVFKVTPGVRGAYASINSFYNMVDDTNDKLLEQHEASLMGRKAIMKVYQDAMLELKQQNPERFNQIMEANGMASAKNEEAMAALWYSWSSSGKISLDEFDYALSKNNKEDMKAAYESYLNKSK